MTRLDHLLSDAELRRAAELCRAAELLREVDLVREAESLRDWEAFAGRREPARLRLAALSLGFFVDI
jgi:hypothetical protein